MSHGYPKVETRYANLFLHDKQLKPVNYTGALQDFCFGLCKDIFGEKEDLNHCVREMKVPVDCVVRSKIRKMGMLNDNLKICKHEISLMKNEIEAKYSKKVMEETDANKKMDSAFYILQNQLKSFV